jgi:hypothetical protein
MPQMTMMIQQGKEYICHPWDSTHDRIPLDGVLVINQFKIKIDVVNNEIMNKIVSNNY